MSYPFPIRLLLGAILSLALALLLVVLLYATDLGLNVWVRLQEAPAWFITSYAVGLMGLLGGGGWLLWRVLSPGRPGGESAPDAARPPRSEAELRERISEAEARGISTADAERELAALSERSGSGEIHICLFGQVSTGKSSIVNALIPGSSPRVDPRAGTTRKLSRYEWSSPAGDHLVLTDMPGIGEPQTLETGAVNPAVHLDPVAREEAMRAHVVVYVVDGDLTRDQYVELRALLKLDKPVVLALNKADLYTDHELDQIRGRLVERADDGARINVVSISTGVEREVVRILPGGREERVMRPAEPRLTELVSAIQGRIDEDGEALEQLRDAAVFTLAGRKLDAALAEHRRQRSDEIVSSYTRKAVLGALAAVTPGTDVVIQGYLGVQLVKELCGLYDVAVKDVDVSSLLDLVARRLGRKATPLLLAVAGNALKAFPGVGTLAGGAMHAVAYGLLFDSLGRAVARTLASRNALPQALTLRNLEESLSDNVETRAKRLAQVALEKGATAVGAGSDRQP